jgi:hypothetical protein
MTSPICHDSSKGSFIVVVGMKSAGGGGLTLDRDESAVVYCDGVVVNGEIVG